MPTWGLGAGQVAGPTTECDEEGTHSVKGGLGEPPECGLQPVELAWVLKGVLGGGPWPVDVDPEQ